MAIKNYPGWVTDEMLKRAYAVVVYEMKNGAESRFPCFSSDELKHERGSAEREMHDPKGYVAGYRVEWP